MRTANKIYASALSAAALLILLASFKLIAPAEFYAGRVFSPALGYFSFWSAKVRAVFDARAGQDSLIGELGAARSELNSLRAENAALKVVEDENRALRELLKFTEGSGHGNIVSRVVARGSISDISGQTEAIVINRGRRDGVVLGAAVVDASGVMIGKVTDLKDSSAQVDLLNSRRCKVAAAFPGLTGTGGVVSGELGLSVTMHTIPQDAQLSLGDTVITSGLEESIPRGLAIGKIISISKENNELWQTAGIEPFFSAAGLLIVSVVTP